MMIPRLKQLWHAASTVALLPMGLAFRQPSARSLSLRPTFVRRHNNIMMRMMSSSSSSDNNSKPTIAFVTGNPQKLKEVQTILASEDDFAFNIVNVALDLPEWQGDPLEIARSKCRQAVESNNGKACFTEDTSLCFDALNGLPGPYIKDFLEKCGHEGLNKLLDGFGSDPVSRGASAQTVIAFCAGNPESIQLFVGQTRGMIVPPRGPLDFGWDPIFQPTEQSNHEHGWTYAEMGTEAKNAISHRGKAMEQFRQYLVTESDTIIEEMQQYTSRSTTDPQKWCECQ